MGAKISTCACHLLCAQSKQQHGRCTRQWWTRWPKSTAQHSLHDLCDRLTRGRSLLDLCFFCWSSAKAEGASLFHPCLTRGVVSSSLKNTIFCSWMIVSCFLLFSGGHDIERRDAEVSPQGRHRLLLDARLQGLGLAGTGRRGHRRGERACKCGIEARLIERRFLPTAVVHSKKCMEERLRY